VFGPIIPVTIAQINYGGELLAGRTVLITGGSRGIGLAIAKKCLSEGATVVITGRNTETLQAVSERLNHDRLHTLPWDIADISLLEEKLHEALELLGGKLDVLVNNAGISAGRAFGEIQVEDWDRTYGVNSKGSFFLTQAMTVHWRKRGIRGGKILNIASSSGFLGAHHPYGMSKWDIVGMTAGLGYRMAPYGILINALAPGRTATEMLGLDSSGDNVADSFAPIRRYGLPEEMAEFAVFLMSDAANFIVGQTILCDGGRTLKAA
jgi:3-oxoacyl-[acyl-carrier protein] reductase